MYIFQGRKRKIANRKRGARLKAQRKAKERRRVNRMHGRKLGQRIGKARKA